MHILGDEWTYFILMVNDALMLGVRLGYYPQLGHEGIWV